MSHMYILHAQISEPYWNGCDTGGWNTHELKPKYFTTKAAALKAERELLEQESEASTHIEKIEMKGN